MSYKENISEKYKYYIIRIKLNERYFYCLWGPNNRNMDDQFLINKDNLIIKFRSIKDIRNNSKKIKKYNYQTYRFNKWLNELIKTKIKSNCTIDFDNIYKIFTGNFIPLNINSKFLNDYIIYINLFDDYAIQNNDNKMLSLGKRKNIRNLWLFTYDYYFWQVQGKEKIKTVKLISTKWDPIKFREEFKMIYDSFENSFTWL